MTLIEQHKQAISQEVKCKIVVDDIFGNRYSVNGVVAAAESCTEITLQTMKNFQIWLSDNEWVRRTTTHPNKVGKYYSNIHCQYKTLNELIKEFLKSNNNDK